MAQNKAREVVSAKTSPDQVYYTVLKILETTFNNPSCKEKLQERYPALNFIVTESLWNCIKAAMTYVRKEGCFLQALDYNSQWYDDPEELAGEIIVCIIDALDRYNSLKLGSIEELANPINLENITKKFIVFLTKSLKSVLFTNNPAVKSVVRYVTLIDNTTQIMGEREFHSKKRKMQPLILEVTSRRECVCFSEIGSIYSAKLSKQSQGNKELTESEIIDDLMDRYVYYNFMGGYSIYVSDPELYAMLKEEIEREDNWMGEEELSSPKEIK